VAERTQFTQKSDGLRALNTTFLIHRIFAGLVQIIKIELFADNRRNHIDITRQLTELFGIKTLRTIRKRMVRIMMDFDHQCVGTGSDRSPCHGANFFTNSRCMTRIDQHRQMGQFF